MKLERHIWDDDPSNNNGWYDAEQVEEFLRWVLKNFTDVEDYSGHTALGQQTLKRLKEEISQS